jgi:gluconate 2-dehydrogenase gamma chain
MKAGAAGAAASLTLPRQAAAEPQTMKGAGTPPQQHPTAAPMAMTHNDTMFFFNDEEARFVTAAIDRLIPADDWGGAKEAGVLYYIDHQLAGAYGTGDRMYLKGPWSAEASPQQGYQLRFSPAELYRVAIGEIRDRVRKQSDKKEFWELSADQMDSVLKDLESGKIELPSVPSPVFFETLLANTIEGYFSDPVYGGNRGMIAWQMIGFPGAYAQYVELVDKFGYELDRPPLSIAGAATGSHDDMHGEGQSHG